MNSTNIPEDIHITRQEKPNILELTALFEMVFNELDVNDQSRFDKDQNGQELSEWFDIQELNKYIQHGRLIEARDIYGHLVGAIFIGKQNPLTWPDGHKVEVFILGVNPKFRGKGIGTNLIREAEKQAKEMGARKIIVNTHTSLEADQRYYKKLGYSSIGTLTNYYDNGSAVFYSKELV